MFRAVLSLALLLSAAAAMAQQSVPASQVNAFAIRDTDENSPFFLDARAKQAADQTDSVRPPTNELAAFPSNKGPDASVLKQVTGFFTGMFSSVNLGPLRGAPPVSSSLKVDPASFPLQDRREINVTYTITNNTKRIMRLEYPTTQRIDIITYDAQGNMIDKWSDDRSFQAEDGIVVINPKERIEYQEKIPTREMKAGQNYRVDTFATTDPNYLTQQPVQPQ